MTYAEEGFWNNRDISTSCHAIGKRCVGICQIDRERSHTTMFFSRNVIKHRDVDMKPADRISVQKPFSKCGGICFPSTSFFGRWIAVSVKHNWGCHAIFYNRAISGNGQF